MKKSLVVVVVFLFSLMLTACGAGAAGSASTSLEVDMVEFMFEPVDFTIPAGQEITIQLANNGAIQHEFVIMKYGQQVSVPFDANDEDNIYWEHEVEPGKSETITFTAPTDPGEYQIVCGIPGHFEAGMTAKLIVK